MSTRPNILLILTDQQRYDTLSSHLNHFQCQTPGIDSLVNRGVLFENAFTTSPICCPARASIMTGLYPSKAGVPHNVAPPLGEGLMTIGDRMQAAGYETVYFGKSHIKGDLRHYGFERCFENSHDESTQMRASRFWRNRDWITEKRPFFQVLSFMNPHDIYFLEPGREMPFVSQPWANTRPFDKMEDLPRQQRNYVDWPNERWAYYRRFYGELIELVDTQIKTVLQELIRSGFASNTWIIFTSDHGDMAGEHGIPFKGTYTYEGVLRVPMIIVPPDLRWLGKTAPEVTDLGAGFQARKSSSLVSHIDLVPTILEIAGIPPSCTLPGKSFLPVVRGGAFTETKETFAEIESNTSVLDAIRMIRTREWKYNLSLSGEDELFDLQQDPNEMKNLATTDSNKKMKAEMKASLLTHLKQEGDSFLDRLDYFPDRQS